MNVGLGAADPNLAEFFQIVRSATTFVVGGTENEQTLIEAFGNVSAASARDIDALPEGDHVTETLAFWCQRELFVTHANGDGTQGVSDVLVWRGEQYRILSVLRYPSRGYWKALAMRMSGD